MLAHSQTVKQHFVGNLLARKIDWAEIECVLRQACIDQVYGAFPDDDVRYNDADLGTQIYAESMGWA